MIFISILAFLAILMVVVLVHEWGHFASARRHGVKVHEFGMGLPPKAKTLYTDKKGTEYTLNYLPLGGFVRMEGEETVSEAPDSFASKSILARMEIVLAGIFMNVVLFFTIMIPLFMYGAPPMVLTQESLDRHIEQEYIISHPGVPVISLVEGAAMKAGILPRDIVLSIDGTEVNTSADAMQLQEAGKTHMYIVSRDDQVLNIPVTPNENGKIGVYFAEANYDATTLSLSFIDSTRYAGSIFIDAVIATKTALSKLVGSIVNMVMPQDLAGPVGIAGMTHEFVKAGAFIELLQFMALISLSLAIMNVLPIPALDGGRLVFICIEAVFGKVNEEVEQYIHAASYLALISLILIISIKDVMMLIQ